MLGSDARLNSIEPRLMGDTFYPDKDILCAYHRAQRRKVGQQRADPADTETGGHYEVIAWATVDGQPLISRFKPGHPGHVRLSRLCQETLAALRGDAARARMEENYNRQLVVRQFKVMEGVGVRTTQGKRVSKARGSFNLPAVVIQVIEEPPRGKQADNPVPRESYRLLTQFGLITTLVKADDLTPLTLNNHPELKAAVTPLRRRWRQRRCCVRSWGHSRDLHGRLARLTSAHINWRRA
jgi:hypothetical protein